MKRRNYWTARAWHDWEPLYNWRARWNWIDFTFCALTAEHADYVSPHEWEIHVALLGFHVVFVYVNAAKVDAWDTRIEDFTSSLHAQREGKP